MNYKARSRVICQILLVLVAGLAVASCKQTEQTKNEHLKRGEELLAQKQHQAAVLEFRAAEQLDNKSGAAYWGLTRAYEGSGDVAESVAALRRTVELDPNNLEAQVKMGNYALIADQNSEAEATAQNVLKKDPNYIEAHVLLASLYFKIKQPQETLRELTRALEIDPRRVETHLYLAEFYRMQKDLPKAEESYRRAISLDERAAKAHIAYGNFLAQQKRLEEAEGEFKRAVALNPSDREVQFTLGAFYAAAGALDKAEAVYKGVAEREPNAPEAGAALATFYFNSGRRAEGVRLFREVVSRFPDDEKSRLQLSDFLLHANDLKGAAEQVEALMAKSPQKARYLLQRARVLLLNGTYEEAVADLEAVLQAQPRSRDTLYLLTEAYLEWGKNDEADSAANSFVMYHPTYLPARIMQARAHVGAGKDREAVKVANEVLDQLAKLPAPTSKDGTDTVALYVRDMRVGALTWRGMAKANLGDLKGATADLEQVAKLVPNSSPAYLNLARASMAAKNGAAAARLFEQALSLDGTNFATLSDLTQLYINERRGGDAMAHIDTALSRDGGSTRLHVLKGVVLGSQGRLQEAEAEFRSAQQADPNYTSSYYALAELYARTNKLQLALEQYKELVRRNLAVARTYTLMGVIEEQQGDYDAAAANYRQALELNSGEAEAANNLAWVYAEYGKGPLYEAARLAQTAVDKDPKASNFLHTSGYVYRKLGMYKQAVVQFKKAVSIDGGNAAHHVQLGLALMEAGDKPGARQEIEQGLRLPPTGGQQQYDQARKVLSSF